MYWQDSVRSGIIYYTIGPKLVTIIIGSYHSLCEISHQPVPMVGVHRAAYHSRFTCSP